MIKASKLSKKYHKKLAVDNVSFTVESGKVTGFLGPNGAGKSTTMRLMLGLDQGEGSTTFDGMALSDYEQPSKVVGVLLEAKAFHPTRSARNHLKVLAAAGGIPDSRVEEVLDIVGLKEVAKKGPGKFSLGMSQRLGIAAAILGEPKYLILDEPANGLDPEGIAWLRNFIKEYATKDRAVLISSHLLSEMSLMADNVIVIGKGKMITDTSMKKLLAKSKTGVLVRTTDHGKLVKALKAAKLKFEDKGDACVVTGAKSEKIAKVVQDAKLIITELSNQTATLEDVFLHLTENAEEYKTKTGGTK